MKKINSRNQHTLFKNYSYSINQAPTFAHELLHLYGAEELYQPQSRYELAADLYRLDEYPAGNL